VNYYVVCTCLPIPTPPYYGCPMHGPPEETVTKTAGEGELWIDMSKDVPPNVPPS